MSARPASVPSLPGVVPWPEELARRYRERGVRAGITLGDAFARSVAKHATRVAVVDGPRRVTYAELGVLAAHLAARYYRAEEHNRTAFTADGFYRTGDLVRRLSSGHLVVEGRTKDLIDRGGPAVLNVAVVAMPDPVLGERACACVIPRPGASLSLGELTRFLLQEGRIAKFKLPERLKLHERFPMTAVGKIARELRDEVRQLVEREGTRVS